MKICFLVEYSNPLRVDGRFVEEDLLLGGISQPSIWKICRGGFAYLRKIPTLYMEDLSRNICFLMEDSNPLDGRFASWWNILCRCLPLSGIPSLSQGVITCGRAGVGCFRLLGAINAACRHLRLALCVTCMFRAFASCIYLGTG